MAAPSPVTRVTPNGRKLSKSFPITIALENVPDLDIWEVGVQLPGFEADDFIDTTTQQNSRVRTKATRDLITITNSTNRVQYDPAALTTIYGQVGVAQAITWGLPDGSKYTIYGAIKSFTPDAIEEDSTDPPEADLEIEATNVDPDNCDEQPPVYTAGSGTAATC